MRVSAPIAAMLVATACGSRTVLRAPEPSCWQGNPTLNRCNAPVTPTRIAAVGVDFVARTATAFSLSVGGVVIGSCPNSCDDAGKNKTIQRATHVSWLQLIFTCDPPSQFTIVGTYPDGGIGTIADAAQAFLWDVPTGKTINDSLPASPMRFASSGSIDVDICEQHTRIAGKYDLIFRDGSRVTGDFDAPFCNSADQCKL